MADPLRNFGYTAVSAAPFPPESGAAIEFTNPSVLPDPDADGAFNLVIWPADEALPLSSNAEIIRCTSKTGDVVTIEREQEGTSARSILVGDQVALAATAKTFADAAFTGFFAAADDGGGTGGQLDIGPASAGAGGTSQIQGGYGAAGNVGGAMAFAGGAGDDGAVGGAAWIVGGGEPGFSGKLYGLTDNEVGESGQALVSDDGYITWGGVQTGSGAPTDPPGGFLPFYLDGASLYVWDGAAWQGPYTP